MIPTSSKALLIISLALLAVFIMLAGPAACNAFRSKGAQSRVEKAQTGAVVNSAKDAIATQEASTGRERASEGLTATNTKEITSAEGADIKVHPGVNDAGIRSLCRRAAYRDSDRCRVQPASTQ